MGLRNSDTGGRWGDGGWMGVGGSMLRLSWALTILGAQHAQYLVERRHENANEFRRASRPMATSPVDAVLNLAEEQFGGVFRGVYRMGREYLPGVGKVRS